MASKLLIAPEGIEISFGLKSSWESVKLLIAPEGIEIEYIEALKNGLNIS